VDQPAGDQRDSNQDQQYREGEPADVTAEKSALVNNTFAKN
jgi:hypothetical protein